MKSSEPSKFAASISAESQLAYMACIYSNECLLQANQSSLAGRPYYHDHLGFGLLGGEDWRSEHLAK